MIESVGLAKALACICGAGAVGITTIAFPFISPAFRKICLPYVPATSTQLQNVTEALRMCPRGALIDLGSGDGRIVFEAAKHGFTATGVELNSWLVGYSRLRSWQLKLHNKTSFRRIDIFKVDLSNYSTVVFFGAETELLMNSIQSKLKSELKPGSLVLACRFPLPVEKPVRQFGSGTDSVWLYKL